MYLHYEKYKEYGGNLSNTEFDRFSFRADKEIDNATLSRCITLEVIPEEVSRCAFELIKYLSKHNQNGATKSITSVGNDGYSVSYSNQETAQKEICDIIYTYLSDTGLMYCGVD